MILIDRYEPPLTCGDCFALDEHGDYPMCRITGETRGYTFIPMIRTRRMDKCPIKDADAVVVVRCKDCKWSRPMVGGTLLCLGEVCHGMTVGRYDYCGWGKKER